MIDRSLILLILCLLAYPIWADTHVVEPGTSLNSIKMALKQSNNGDTILVKYGHYKEGQIIVEKSVALIGEEFPIIDGEHNTEILTIEADSVTVQGLQFQNVGTSYIKDRAAIKVESQKHCTITGNKLRDAFFGIYLAKSKHCTISDNDILGDAKDEASSGNAIHLWYCKDITITNNSCSGHRDGIYIEFSEESDIADNQSQDNLRYGLHFMFSDYNTYTRNTFSRNNAGVAVMYSSYIRMYDNYFTDNWGSATYGILLKEIKDSELYHNHFENNTVGVFAEGVIRVEVRENNFEHNGWAVVIRGSCESNTFSKNNFLFNSFELSTNSKHNMDNLFTGNYWSDFTGYDLDHDGVGDVPHNPVSLFSYIVENNPTAILLMRSFFIDLLNLAEQITPVLTPVTLTDAEPLMEEVLWYE